MKKTLLLASVAVASLTSAASAADLKVWNKLVHALTHPDRWWTRTRCGCAAR